MIKKIEANLIYIKEIKNKGNLEIKRTVKADLGDVFSQKYFRALDRDIELNCTLKIREFYKEEYLGYQLRYVELNGTRYIIDKINSLRGRFILLDLAEDL